MKNTGLYGYVYDFSVDYDIADVDDILDIHKYLKVKNNIKQFLDKLNMYLLHCKVLVDCQQQNGCL